MNTFLTLPIFSFHTSSVLFSIVKRRRRIADSCMICASKIKTQNEKQTTRQHVWHLDCATLQGRDHRYDYCRDHKQDRDECLRVLPDHVNAPLSGGTQILFCRGRWWRRAFLLPICSFCQLFPFNSLVFTSIFF